ncbi:MAG: sodium:proton antiporter, partial [Alphaproteobacteria bacterium]|nr:sodium:proton antiporter [Alphaproteobacteria bacterium]
MAATVLSCGTAIAADAAHVDGAALTALWAIPFVGLLLSIAILPLAAPGLWHHHYGKVTAAWALAFLVPFALMYGSDVATFEFMHVMLLDYVPFIVLLFALYTISGGVYISGDIRGTPLTNTG